MGDREPPAEAADLFRMDPERFVAERDDLVKRLRAEGRAEDAASVKALRKPTAVVWALNQLAARDREGLDALFETGRRLRAAQQAALAGGRGDDLVDASAGRRDAVSRLTTVAVATLDERGNRGATQADAVASALDAASTDPVIGARLASGTLQQAPSAAADLGFGDMPTIAAVPGGAGEPTDGPSRADLVRLRRERDAASKTARTKRATAERLAAQVADLTERLERATAEHADAESAALEAELEAERATRLVDDER
jgi:hypothetical protein